MMVQKNHFRGEIFSSADFFVTVEGTIFKGGSVSCLSSSPLPRINPSCSTASKETAILRTEMSHPLLQLDF